MGFRNGCLLPKWRFTRLANWIGNILLGRVAKIASSRYQNLTVTKFSVKIPFSLVIQEGFFMLSLYVNILESIQDMDRAGEDPTITKLAKASGLSYHKVKNVVADLLDFGFVYYHELHHRPNKNKRHIFISPTGASWVYIMRGLRMAGF